MNKDAKTGCTNAEVVIAEKVEQLHKKAHECNAISEIIKGKLFGAEPIADGESSNPDNINDTLELINKVMNETINVLAKINSGL